MEATDDALEAKDKTALWQIGTAPLNYWGGQDPLINILQVNTEKSEWPADVFDQATQTFLRLPDGEQAMQIGLLRVNARYNASYYAGDYIIEWEGKGLVETNLAGGGVINREGANRVREVYDGTTADWAGIVIKEIGEGGIRNIRVYRAEHEEALKAGKIFNPAFVEKISKYDIVRPMNWNMEPKSRITDADQIPHIKTQFWGDRFAPIEAQFKLAHEAGVALWLNAPSRLGAPEGVNERLSRINDEQIRRPAIAEQFDKTKTSKEWMRYARRIVKAMDATDYPLDRPFYLELANETWHLGGGFQYASEWFWGMSDALSAKTGEQYAGYPPRGGYGYFSARLAEAFAAALEEHGRSGQQWILVIGAQTAWGAQAVGALEGVAVYDGGAHMQAMHRFGVATTGYYQGVFHNGGMRLFGRKMGDEEWRTEWVRRFEENKATFQDYLLEAMTSDQAPIHNVEWIVRQAKQHDSIAKRFGAQYIGQYEGASHDALDQELAKIPEVREFYTDWQKGSPQAEIIRLHAERMNEEFPGVILSMYHHFGPLGVQPQWPWLLNTAWDEPTQAEQALFEAMGE